MRLRVRILFSDRRCVEFGFEEFVQPFVRQAGTERRFVVSNGKSRARIAIAPNQIIFRVEIPAKESDERAPEYDIRLRFVLKAIFKRVVCVRPAQKLQAFVPRPFALVRALRAFAAQSKHNYRR